MPLAYEGRDEKALQSRRRSDQRARPQGAKAKAPLGSKTASSSAPILDAEVARLTRELSEALERR